MHYISCVLSAFYALFVYDIHICVHITYVYRLCLHTSHYVRYICMILNFIYIYIFIHTDMRKYWYVHIYIYMSSLETLVEQFTNQFTWLCQVDRFLCLGLTCRRRHFHHPEDGKTSPHRSWKEWRGLSLSTVRQGGAWEFLFLWWSNSMWLVKDNLLSF